jgi:hypothetical protein
MHKELIERLRTLPVFDDTTIGNEAADAIEARDKHLVKNTKLCIKRIAEITEERDTLRQQLAEAQKDADRYRFLRDNFATKSENSVDDFIALEPMTGEYFDAHIDILMSEFHAAMKGAA